MIQDAKFYRLLRERERERERGRYGRLEWERKGLMISRRRIALNLDFSASVPSPRNMTSEIIRLELYLIKLEN